MAATGGTPIILYHSTTASAVPSNTNLAAGELGLNIADMKLYCENDSGTVTLLASAASTDGDFAEVTLLAQGDLKFNDADDSNYVAFQAPATVATNVTWTLPDADGNNGEVLATNGSGRGVRARSRM